MCSEIIGGVTILYGVARRIKTLCELLSDLPRYLWFRAKRILQCFVGLDDLYRRRSGAGCKHLNNSAGNLPKSRYIRF
jgi:hypothetical protein